ncbi:hypothetical protein ACFQH8_19515 [Halomicroarcula sp. GCM10025710]
MTRDTDDRQQGTDFEDARHRLDDSEAFGDMRNTPYYEDAVYPSFSDDEYERRYRITREKMADRGLDALVVPGGPYHWSHGGAMLWLTGHWNWHSMVEYVVVPRGRPGARLLVRRHPRRGRPAGSLPGGRPPVPKRGVRRRSL